MTSFAASGRDNMIVKVFPPLLFGTTKKQEIMLDVPFNFSAVPTKAVSLTNRVGFKIPRFKNFPLPFFFPFDCLFDSTITPPFSAPAEFLVHRRFEFVFFRRFKKRQSLTRQCPPPFVNGRSSPHVSLFPDPPNLQCVLSERMFSRSNPLWSVPKPLGTRP